MERPQHKEKELRYFCMGSAVILFIAAFYFGSLEEILKGMLTIIYSRDALITDYFQIAGYATGFFNAGLMLLLTMGLVHMAKVPYSGPYISSDIYECRICILGQESN